MVLEGRILRYYLKIFSFLLIIFFIIYIYFILNIFTFNFKNNEIIINKGDNLEKIIYVNFTSSNKLDKFFFKNYIKFYNLFIDHIHYGEFYLEKNINFSTFIKTISKPSNIINKLTIVEGSSKSDLNKELNKIFNTHTSIDYNAIIADTYFIEDKKNFNKFKTKMIDFKNNFFLKFNNNPLLSKYNIDEIMIIGSLIEKEGLDYQDKRLISSVILNRLEKKMKLQIDATVVYAITEGKYKINRNLNYSDLKIDNPFNTYKINGLPPQPISYVGSKTIELIMENYKTNYLFYFYDIFEKKHIFSKNYKNHIKKLNEYRK